MSSRLARKNHKSRRSFFAMFCLSWRCNLRWFLSPKILPSILRILLLIFEGSSSKSHHCISENRMAWLIGFQTSSERLATAIIKQSTWEWLEFTAKSRQESRRMIFNSIFMSFNDYRLWKLNEVSEPRTVPTLWFKWNARSRCSNIFSYLCLSVIKRMFYMKQISN